MHHFINTPLAIDAAFARAVRAQLDKNPDYLAAYAQAVVPMPSFLEVKGVSLETPSMASNNPTNAEGVNNTASAAQNAQGGSTTQDLIIATIPIMGVMARYDQNCSMGMETIGAWIRQADNDPQISGIMLQIDSPGGQVNGMDGLYTTIKNTTKPIVAFVKGMAASGGYFAAMATDSIILETPLMSMVGSIGVLIANEYETAPKTKIEFVRADGSEDKATIEPNSKLSAENIAELKAFINPLRNDFVAKVKENRPKVSDKALTGKMFTGREAIKMGLADKIGPMEVAIKEILRLRKQAS